MQFQIDTSSREPIYRQLAGQIRQGVARGRLKPEQKLPSVRELSRSLVINPNTIARVYTELEREGVLHTRQGKGVFIAAPNNDLTKAARRKQLMDLLDTFLTQAFYLGFTKPEVIAAVTNRAEQIEWGQG